VTRQRVLALAWNHGPVTVLAALLVMLACIWGASLGSHPASAAAAVSAPDRPGVTAEGIHDDLAAVLADQRQADRDHREAWIADGYSSDLATLVTDTDQAGGGTGALDAHARAFSDDGQAYLDAAGLTAVRPPPGWQGPYAQLRADLNRLAADEGLAPVPVPRGVISAAPGTADPKIPVPVPDANACASAGNTVTNSSSSTGASSHSVKAKTTCGTQSSSVTHKTSVTAKGAVTNTTTTTTSNGAGSSSSSSGSSG
jgi:hypothetical protein